MLTSSSLPSDESRSLSEAAEALLVTGFDEGSFCFGRLGQAQKLLQKNHAMLKTLRQKTRGKWVV